MDTQPAQHSRSLWWAALLAPLVSPVVQTLFFASKIEFTTAHFFNRDTAWLMVGGLLLAYALTWLLGIPAALLLRKIGWLRAPSLCLCGAVMGATLSVSLYAPVLGQGDVVAGLLGAAHGLAVALAACISCGIGFQKTNRFDRLLQRAGQITHGAAISTLRTATPDKPMPLKSFRLYYGMRDQGDFMNHLGLDMAIRALLAAALLVLAFLLGADGSLDLVYGGRMVAEAVAFVCLLMLNAKTIVHVLSYPRNVHWAGRLNFPLAGWADIADHQELLHENSAVGNWYTLCTVQILRKTGCTPPSANLIEAASIVLCKQANDIEQRFESGLTPWSISGDELRGSANISVLGSIQRFVANDLNPINQLYDAIAEVRITSSNEFIKISTAATGD